MDMPGVGVGSEEEQAEKRSAATAAVNTVRAINFGLLGIAKLCSIGFYRPTGPRVRWKWYCRALWQ